MKLLRLVRNTALATAPLLLVFYSISAYSAASLSAVIKIKNQTGDAINIEVRNRKNFERPPLCSSPIGKSCTITLKAGTTDSDSGYRYKFRIIDPNTLKYNVYQLYGCNIIHAGAGGCGAGFAKLRNKCTLKRGVTARTYMAFRREKLGPHPFSSTIEKTCTDTTAVYTLTIPKKPN